MSAAAAWLVSREVVLGFENWLLLVAPVQVKLSDSQRVRQEAGEGGQGGQIRRTRQSMPRSWEQGPKEGGRYAEPGTLALLGGGGAEKEMPSGEGQGIGGEAIQPGIGSIGVDCQLAGAHVTALAWCKMTSSWDSGLADGVGGEGRGGG